MPSAKLMSTPAAALIQMMDIKGLFDGKPKDGSARTQDPTASPGPASAPMSQEPPADPTDTDASPSEYARRVVFFAETNDWNKTQVLSLCTCIYAPVYARL
jgi:hypothetical protein